MKIRVCTSLLSIMMMVVGVASKSVLMDSSGKFRKPNFPDNFSMPQGIMAMVTSPGTSSLLSESSSAEEIFSLISSSGNDDSDLLTCRGSTIRGMSSAEMTSLAVTSLVADAVLLDGITQGDIQAGFQNSRHARTLTALFRARLLKTDSESVRKQTLILCIKGDVDSDTETSLPSELKALFDSTSVEADTVSSSFETLYDVKVVPVNNAAEAKEVVAIAQQAAAENSEGSSSAPLAKVLEEAYEAVRESDSSVVSDPPHIAQAFVTVNTAYTKYSRMARAKIASWNSRASRGLWVDGFGPDAESLLQRTLVSFDSETLTAAGLPLVAPIRFDQRAKLQTLVESSIRNLFATQVENLQQSTSKKLRAQLLRKLDAIPPDDVPSENAAALRASMVYFEGVMENLQVPSLSLTKVQPSRDMEAKLTNELMTFSDSPAAQLKRTKKVETVTSKEKKPGQRSVDFGLDLVAMLRPDGFGSLQGFAGYQLGGNSVTFGIHNDADDPQVISQFGGVRPPLLRIQPKLRVDVEM